MRCVRVTQEIEQAARIPVREDLQELTAQRYLDEIDVLLEKLHWD